LRKRISDCSNEAAGIHRNLRGGSISDLVINKNIFLKYAVMDSIIKLFNFLLAIVIPSHPYESSYLNEVNIIPSPI
jgi:hypothetical protein